MQNSGWRASHLTENRKSASIRIRSFVTTVALDCSSSVDHGEDSYQVWGQWIVEVRRRGVSWVCIQDQEGEEHQRTPGLRGQCQSPHHCLPGSLDCASWDLETAFAQHFHKLGCHGLVVLLRPLFYGIQHFAGELKRPNTPNTYVVNCSEFHE